jgi:hypothetical protein
VERPGATQVRGWLQAAPWADFGFPAPDPPPTDPAEDPLTFWVESAADYVEEVTGRPLDTMPEKFVRMAQLAIALRTVQQLTGVSADQLEAFAGADVLSSFSADGYSETYKTGATASKQQREGWVVNPWQPLNELLWLLMTDAKKAEWIAYFTGGGIPRFGVTEVDWSGGNRIGWDPRGAPAGEGGLAGDEAGGAVGSNSWNPGLG